MSNGRQEGSTAHVICDESTHYIGNDGRKYGYKVTCTCDAGVCDWSWDGNNERVCVSKDQCPYPVTDINWSGALNANLVGPKSAQLTAKFDYTQSFNGAADFVDGNFYLNLYLF